MIVNKWGAPEAPPPYQFDVPRNQKSKVNQPYQAHQPWQSTSLYVAACMYTESSFGSPVFWKIIGLHIFEGCVTMD